MLVAQVLNPSITELLKSAAGGLNQYGALIWAVALFLGVVYGILKLITIYTKRHRIPSPDGVRLLDRLVTLAFVVVVVAFLSLLTLRATLYLSKAPRREAPEGAPDSEANRFRELDQQLKTIKAEIVSLRAMPQAPLIPSPVEAPQRQYKLVWYNHRDADGMLWEVLKTDLSQHNVGNQMFTSWCKPFRESDWVVHKRLLVAADEEFKPLPDFQGDNWWAKPPYNLPALLPSWLRIMDDERWYFYEVTPVIH